MPTYTVKSGSGIEDGLHIGTIKALDENEREGTDKQGKKVKFSYTDIIISVDGTETDGEPKELKYGCPTPKGGTINPKSKLGKILSLFVNLEEGAPIDTEQILIGKKIQFQTSTNDNGFSEILDKSIKKK